MGLFSGFKGFGKILDNLTFGMLKLGTFGLVDIDLFSKMFDEDEVGDLDSPELQEVDINSAANMEAQARADAERDMQLEMEAEQADQRRRDGFRDKVFDAGGFDNLGRGEDEVFGSSSEAGKGLVDIFGKE